MKRRLLIITLALLMAAIGAGGVLAYVNRANDRAIAGLKAVTVLTAGKKIASGTSAGAALHDGLLITEKLPASSVPSNAVQAITPGLSPLVLSSALQPGQLLLRPMLVTPVHTTGGMALPNGMIAITLTFCLAEAVAGDVQPGSQVAVFDTVVGGSSGGASAEPACAGSHTQINGTAKTRLVLTRVRVLSVGTGQPSTSSTTAASSSSSSQGGVMLTVAVTQADAERLIAISETGLPYLALLSSTSHTTTDARFLLSPRAHATPAAQPTPAPVATVAAPAPSASPTHTARSKRK
jgi:pilus assembly protein CpaB